MRDASAKYGSAAGWMLVDGASLGLGVLLERAEADAEVVSASPRQTSPLDRYLPLIARQPKTASADGPLPAGVSGPVRRWRAAG